MRGTHMSMTKAIALLAKLILSVSHGASYAIDAEAGDGVLVSVHVAGDTQPTARNSALEGREEALPPREGV